MPLITKSDKPIKNGCIAIVGGVIVLLLILGLIVGMAEWAKH
jgi:hypothetical protein